MSCNQLNEQNLTKLVETMVPDSFSGQQKWPPVVTADQKIFPQNQRKAQSSSTASGPFIALVGDMPEADVAKALILSTFSSSISWLFQSVMVLSVFSPVTVQRVFTAPYSFIAAQFAVIPSTALSTSPSNSQSVNDTNIGLSFVKSWIPDGNGH